MCRRCLVESRIQASGKRRRREWAQMATGLAEVNGPLSGWYRRMAARQLTEIRETEQGR